MTARGSLLLALCVGCLVAPGDSHAQKPGGISRVGVLATLHGQEDYLGFTRAMAALGYTEGKNLVIEWRFADGRYDALPELAAELVRKNVAVLVAVDGTASALAARNATSRIPIVFSGVGDLSLIHI